MATSSNTSSDPQYIAFTRKEQEVMSRMILVDFTVIDMQNATIAMKQRMAFIATLAGLPTSQVKNIIAQSNEQVVTQATTIADVRERYSALMKKGSDLNENKTNLNRELALTKQRVKDLEERLPTCIYRDLQTNITELEQSLPSRMPTHVEEV
jgi:hypothetical protein